MSKANQRQGDDAWLEARSSKQEAGERPGSTLKTIKIEDFRQKDRYTITLDLSNQVLRLDLPADIEYASERGSRTATLYHAFSELKGTGSFLSAAALASKAKQFDDGLFAAVELAANRGTASFPGKRDLLEKLVRVLSQSGPEAIGSPAASILTAAARLGGLKAAVPEALAQSADKDIQEFLGNTFRSKPLGFYTWSPELVRIFQQDRMLQTKLDEPAALLLARHLSRDASLFRAYAAALRLAERLTNPFPLYKTDLRQLSEDLAAGRKAVVKDETSFFPPSASHEAELIKKLYGNRPIPEGFNLADQMVRRIRSGELSLQPTSTSGWYDYQVFALEPLAIPEKMPEAKRLEFSAAYQQELVGLLKSLLALTRETHIKQLEIPTAGAGLPELEIRPELSLEPLATYYLRRARSYRFVRQVLEETFGRADLGRMRRITADGPINLPLDEELNLLQSIFHGAYLVVCDELGLAPESGEERDGMDRQVFRTWSASLEKDSDLNKDSRMMVPVFFDTQRRQMKVWVVLGLATKPLQISFARPPAIQRVMDSSGKELEAGEIVYRTADHRLAYLVTAELYVTRLLDRREFREHCDRYQTAEAILSHLK